MYAPTWGRQHKRGTCGESKIWIKKCRKLPRYWKYSHALSNTNQRVTENTNVMKVCLEVTPVIVDLDHNDAKIEF